MACFQTAKEYAMVTSFVLVLVGLASVGLGLFWTSSSKAEQKPTSTKLSFNRGADRRARHRYEPLFYSE
jgi:hypothetical protein